MSVNALAATGPLPDDVVTTTSVPLELQVLATLRDRYTSPSYSPNTWAAYAADLRIFGVWCQERNVSIFGATRQHIEAWMRDMAAEGRAPATIRRRWSRSRSSTSKPRTLGTWRESQPCASCGQGNALASASESAGKPPVG